MENIIRKIVDNRALVLAVDYLYRDYMKRYEVEKLLAPSGRLVEKLNLTQVDVPVEGYYTENDELKDYFLNVRTLQKCPVERKGEVESSAEYQLLSRVISSEIYGKGLQEDFFTSRLDPLYYALESIPVSQWSVETITQQAKKIAIENDDISLVGIAASLGDSVVLAALRESVALYGAIVAGCAVMPVIEYEWNVDEALQQKVNRFIELFNELTSSDIKPASPDNVEYFYQAYEDNDIMGRCIYIGYDDSHTPVQKYHWAIKPTADGLLVDDFWAEELWTTERYQDGLLFS